MGMFSIDENIETSDDIEFLRRIRDLADQRLQQVKNERYKAGIADLRNKYVGKYVLIYGKQFTMTMSFTNKNDINIFHIKEITDVCSDKMFRIIGRQLRICTDDQYEEIKHISASASGSLIVSVTDGETKSLYEKDIEAILEPAQVDEYIKHAAGLQSELLKAWKEACDEAV